MKPEIRPAQNRPARRWAAPAAAVLTVLNLVYLAGCGLLSTETPAPPSAGLSARNIPLTTPDSVLANVVEAFRVGSVTAYMRSIYDPITSNGADTFTVFFSPEDKSELSQGAPPGDLRLLNGAWHVEHERNAMSSVMNPFSTTADPGRAEFTVVDRNGGSTAQPRWLVSYRLNISVGNAQFFEGTASLTFVLDGPGNYKILTWEDARKVPPPSPSTWGKLRFQNRS